MWTTFPLTKVGPPIFEWAVPRPFVHLRVEIMVLFSIISDWIFVRINLNAYSDSLSHFRFKVQHYIIFFSSLWTTFSLTKVGPPVIEWAVPRPFVHLRVEIMVLLSMISYSIFVRINLNAYSDSLSCFCFKVRHYIIFFEFVNHFFIDKSRAAHLWVGCAKTVCPSSSGNNGAFVNELRLDICKNQFKCL